MTPPVAVIKSALPGVAWPAITRPQEALALALQYQLERSQWLPSAELRELQLRQLDALLPHAWNTVPFYRWHWHGAYRPDAAFPHESFERLPLLGRADLEREFEALRSTAPPAAHGAVAERQAHGDAGSPARRLTTALAGLWEQALQLRDHLWHGRNFDGTLAAIRAGVAEGEAPGWGPESSMVEGSGRLVTLDAQAGLDAQLAWLERHEPDYLLASPASAAALARASLTRGIRLARLREVRTIGEPASAGTRALCREAWGVPLTGMYWAAEAGCIGLQCPGHEHHYHVQAESLLVEVLDEVGGPCPPGIAGRVVVTTLQDFAMPLVRYDLGDRAELGGPCSCGRGLPVLRPVASRAGAQAGVSPARP